jgi:IS30 family transposase
LLRRNWGITRIANVLEKDRKTIREEVKRNTEAGCTYAYGYAQNLTISRRKIAKAKFRKIESNLNLQKQIIKHLALGHSPEQIAGRYKKVGMETIYRWIYIERRDLIKFLCFKKNQFRKRRGTLARIKHRRIKAFRGIEDRPEIVETKERLGDFEGDTIVGKDKKDRILTHVDRRSGYCFLDLVLGFNKDKIHRKIHKTFSKLPKSKKHTITYDNGVEFGGEDEFLEKKTKTRIYRARPYHSWERGANENLNGLVRRFFPKGKSFAILTQSDLELVAKNLNNRPRKRLGFMTPYEVFVLDRQKGVVQSRM